MLHFVWNGLSTADEDELSAIAMSKSNFTYWEMELVPCEVNIHAPLLNNTALFIELKYTQFKTSEQCDVKSYFIF